VRLSALDIVRFGHLGGVRLDFGASEGVMHVIYGPNEAGKSTTLRAITGLLYGIPLRSPDTHSHGSDLRVAADLIGPEGEQLAVQRRKGRKNTLLDAAGQPIDEAALTGLLRGVGQAAFLSTFGLDHESLRAGGEALLAGHGEVGESLFAAAVGGRGVNGVLGELRKEADALFLPRGKKPLLNAAIAAFRSAKKRSGEEGLRADTWVEQQRVIAQLRAEQQQLQSRRQALSSETGQLQRAVAVLPLLAKRAELLELAAGLQDVVPLPPGAVDERLDVQRALRGAELEVTQYRSTLEELSTRHGLLEIPDSLVDLGQDLIASVRDRLGSHRKAAEDLPRRKERMRSLQGEARASMRRLQVRVPLNEVESLRVSRPVQTRIRELAQAYSGRLAAVQQSRARVQAREVDLEGCVAQLDALPADAPIDALVARVTEARRHGDLDRRTEELRVAAGSIAERVTQRHTSLGRYEGEVEALPSLPLPPAESVDAFAVRFDSHERDTGSLDAELERTEAALEQAGQQLAALQRSASVPTEDDLERARGTRAADYAALIAAKKAELAAARERFEHSVADADAVADRLRREAAQVARLASVLAERDALVARRDRLQQQRQEHAAQGEALRSEWRGRFDEAGIEPLPPAEMRGWLSRHAELSALISEQTQARAALQLATERLATERAALCAALVAAGMDDDAIRDASMSTLLSEAETRIEDGRQRAARRQGLQRERAAIERDLAGLRRDADGARDALDVWRSDWTQRMEVLGLGDDASVEEAQDVLEELNQLFTKVDEIEQLSGRIDGMDRDAEEFAVDVKRLTDRHLFQLGEMVIEDAAEQLVTRYMGAQRDLAERQRLAQELERTREKLTRAEAQQTGAQQHMDELLAAAGVDDLPALERAERRAEERRRVEQALQANQDELLQRGDGAQVDELIEQTAGISADAARARLEDIEHEREQLDEQWQRITRDVASAEQELEQLSGRQGAATAAAEAAEHLAEVRAVTERYLRVRLAERILDQQIRRFREANQAPILRDAGALFARLTLDAYGGLVVDYDAGDEPTLRCVRPDTSEVPVDSLSDGTRDQLYLALRLSALRRQAQHATPMPLVLDDILVHFDDDRARAALGVLGEFASVTQVLFFTHHERLLQLAREAVEPSRLAEHRLSDASVGLSEVRG